MMGSQLAFIKAALKNPLQISTVFQTSPWLADLLISTLPLESAKLLFELGPGAGAITQELLNVMPPTCRYVGIELNLELAEYLRGKFPNLEFRHGAAETCAEITRETGPADAVVSSLPWTVFPQEIQGRTIQAIHQSLAPGGKFSTYVCLNAALMPAAKHLKMLMDQTFTQVTRTRVEFRNIPPAFVYTCTK